MFRENSAKDWTGQWLCHGPCNHTHIRRPQERESGCPGPQEDWSLRATLSPSSPQPRSGTAPWALGSKGLSALPGRAAEHNAVQRACSGLLSSGGPTAARPLSLPGILSRSGTRTLGNWQLQPSLPSLSV